MKKKTSNSILEYRAKIKRYCSIQERCQQDVEKKLNNWGVCKNDVEDVVAELIDDDFLNEQRYSNTYALGKFKFNKWGKIKINYHLKLKRVSNICIKKSLDLLKNEDYLKTINELINQKYKSIKDDNIYVKNAKSAKYLIGKGFESELVWQQIKKIN